MKIVYYHRIRGTGADGTHIKGVIKGFETLGHQVFISSPVTAPDKTAKTKNTKESFILLLLLPSFQPSIKRDRAFSRLFTE